MDNWGDRFFCLHFEGALTRGHTLPATALVQALQNFQRAIYLLAMAERGQEVRQRARITREIEKRYALVCQVPAEGGYALPVVLGDTTDLLVDAYGLEPLAAKVKSVAESIGKGDVEGIVRDIPDRYYRSSVVSAFGAMQPAKNSGVCISIEDYRREKILDGKSAVEKIAQLRASPEPEMSSSLGYVAGELVEMKFQERRLKLKLLISGRGLEANYSEDFEPVLLNHPRDIIQVHGNIIYGEDDIPSSISDVDEILEVDDSPIEIKQVEVGDRLLKPKSCLTYAVKFDVEGQIFETEGQFGINIGGETRPDLESQLYAELSMLWSEFSEVPEEALTTSARILRKELIEAFEVVQDAS